MEVILLSGYRPHPIGTKKLENGEVWLDYQIRLLQEMGLTPVVVLSGRHADETLRVARHLESCELVFDTNENQSTLYTNLRAGLKVTSEACFALPIEVPTPSQDHWHQLKGELLNVGLRTAHHVIHMPPHEGAVWHYGFPLLVTAFGNQMIQKMEDGTGLTDERIRYHRLTTVELATPA
jgi:hypothetical protein